MAPQRPPASARCHRRWPRHGARLAGGAYRAHGAVHHSGCLAVAASARSSRTRTVLCLAHPRCERRLAASNLRPLWQRERTSDDKRELATTLFRRGFEASRQSTAPCFDSTPDRSSRRQTVTLTRTTFQSVGYIPYSESFGLPVDTDRHGVDIYHAQKK